VDGAARFDADAGHGLLNAHIRRVLTLAIAAGVPRCARPGTDRAQMPRGNRRGDQPFDAGLFVTGVCISGLRMVMPRCSRRRQQHLDSALPLGCVPERGERAERHPGQKQTNDTPAASRPSIRHPQSSSIHSALV
jgi:hypothetical protein